MRDVIATLDRLDIRYYVTGSEALGRYAQPRQSMDVDVVATLRPAAFHLVSDPLADGWLAAEPVDFEGHVMASLISRTELTKVDLIFSRDDPWSQAAMDRRERWEHPSLGWVWVISLEDLLLAKLDWSAGTSELQLRDCRSLVALNADRIDWAYVNGHARALGLESLVERVHDAP